ncbi:MAG: uracil phosphoribosyltransferase, partial [Haliscomenobacter sp.]
FEIKLEYISCPGLQDKVLVLADPMLATGASIITATKALLEYGTPAKIHFMTAIASTLGLEQVLREFPGADVWMGGLDEELTAKSYIVPGLGDAGDLAFGEKLQE